jgi:ribulose-phosphate 3-epimerase
MAIIVPAILVQTKEEFEDRITSLPDTVDVFSVDIMDGTFVEPTTFSDASAVKDIETDARYELDLIVNNPLPIIEAWATLPQTVRAIVHAEIDRDIRELLYSIHALGLESGLALLPKTQISDIEHLLNETDMILVRGNEPGYSGKRFLPEMLEKIQNLKNQYGHMQITVDIGVNVDTIPEIVAAGASHLSVNSAIYKTPVPAEALAALQTLAL